MRSELDRGLGALPARIRPVIALDALGYTGREVAESLGLSAKAVEGRLKKGRQLLTDLRELHDGAA